MSDLRTIMERGLGGAAPPPGGFERMLRRRDRKQRNQRITAGLVGMAVFLAAIWIVTTGGPFDRTQTPGASGGATTGPVTTGPTVTPYPQGLGLIGLPPEGATPSTPTNGELVLDFLFGHTMGDPGTFRVYMYADGRLIWNRLGDLREHTTGFIEQRLTPEGVELVRAEVISTGLFDHDLHFSGAPSVTGLLFGAIEVRNADRLVRVTWGDVGPEGVIGEMPTPEQASALQRLDTRLADPASWLPASAWEDPELKAYVPSRYAVCYDARKGNGLDRVLASLPQPAEDLLRTWGRTHGETFGGPGPEMTNDLWCSYVATEEARALAQILEDAGIQELHPRGDLLGYAVRSQDPGDATRVGFVIGPLLPHQP